MSEIKGSINKQLDFYIRAKKEYENAAKPFTYELNIYSTQPKPKKFMIIINKFIDILKQGMKWQYADQEQLKDNYWNELQKLYADTQYEMAYITDNSYEKKKNKLRLYFGLLLNNKKIFQVIKQITMSLDFMYQNPQQKLKDLDRLFEPVEFLKDGQFLILSQFINQYQKYEEQKKKQQKLKQKQAALEKKRLQQIEEAKRKKQQQERLEKQKKAQQEQQRLQKIRIQNELKNKQKQKQTSSKNKISQVLDDQIAFIPQSYQTQYKNDQNTELMRRRQQNKKSFNDLHKLNKNFKVKHQKNSQILFQDKYKDEFQVFSFRLKPQMETSQQKRQKCAECGKQLQKGFYFIGGNQNQCFYTGQWFCNQHIAQQRISIPWKAIESFDLRGYPVSRKSYIEIKSYYEKPIIQIKSQSPIVKHSKQLYDFLVLKRQIHLMYDSICDLELMQPLLKKKLNYCLKQNLFSLKNLYDIYNGHEVPSLQKQYGILSKHFYRCERCQKRKGYICPKCKDPVKIFAFELKQTHGCSNCRKLYHRQCLVGGKCDCQQEE